MSDSTVRPVSALATALYFVLSLLGSVTLADKLSEAMVAARHVSNFEGASGLAAAMSIPTFVMILVATFWSLYFVLRRFPIALYAVLALFAMASVSTISLIASLL